MANIFEFPKVNAVRFFLQSDITYNTATGSILLGVFNPSWQNKQFDSDFLSRMLRDWVDQEYYLQPYQQSDVIKFQWSGSDVTSANYVVRLLDCEGRTYATQVHSQITGTFAGLKVYECFIGCATIPEGVYFIQIQHIQGGADVFAISEPIHIKQVHERSMLIKYSNSYNSQNVKYNNGMNFLLRVHGFIGEMTPDADYHVYEDQPHNLEMISGKVHRSFQIHLHKAPEWIADKLNRATICDTFQIDGIYLTRPENGKIEAERVKENPLCDYTLTMRERYNDDSVVIDDIQSISIAQLPTTSQFYVKTITLGGSSVIMEQGFTGAANFVDYLNNLVHRNIVNLDGFFSVADDGYLYYSKASGETISGTYQLTAGNILPYCMEIGVNVVGTNNTLSFDLISVASKNYAVVWGDGTQVNLTAYSGTVTPSKSYSSQKRYTARIYVSDAEDIDFTPSEDVFVYIGGDLPPSMTGFILTNKNLKSIRDNIWLYTTQAISFDVSDNKLTTIAVNQILRYLYTANQNGTVIAGSSYALDSQSPAAPPAQSEGMTLIRGTLEQTVTITTD
jgi:hypothetical protein